MAKDQTILELAELISSHTKTLTDYIKGSGRPEPSFAPGMPNDIIPDDAGDMQKIRAELVSASRCLADLASGTIRLSSESMVQGHYNTSVLRYIYRYNVPKHVPLEGSISFPELAKAIGADVCVLRRVLRYAFTMRYFTEPRENHIAHTANSHLLATVPSAWDMLGHHTEDTFPASPYLYSAQEKWTGSVDKKHTPMHLAFPDELKDKTIFEWFASNPERAVRFGGAMGFLSVEGGFVNNAQTVNNFDWKALGKAKIVDVGGGRGHVAIGILRSAPELTATVQDLPETISQVNGNIPSDLVGRLEYEAVSFFDPQPIKDAAVYYFRRVLHDWPDAECNKILENLVPSMEKGSRLILSEFVLKPPGMDSMFEEKFARVCDLQMLLAVNAKERTLQDWIQLIEAGSDRRLRFELCEGDLVIFKKQ